MFETQKNILKSATDLHKLPVMVKKLARRLTERESAADQKANDEWLTSSEISAEDWLATAYPEIWEEAETKKRDYFERVAVPLKDTYPAALGGTGGAYTMLYALVRIRQPETVVETGVSLGCSSHAILSALAANKKGHLYSSDFPYFRVENAEKYIGLVVEDHLKDRWSLYIDGDAVNLPKIISQINGIDMFHYDSDKSANGRDFATRIVTPAMNRNGLFLMDDLGDNSFFRTYVQNHKCENRTRVIRYKGKHIGVIDPFETE